MSTDPKETVEKDPKETVETYLKKHGYAIEMETARIFRRYNFNTYQSMFYVDQQTLKNREIDVVAFHGSFIDGVQIEFKIIVECKYAKESWILFPSNEGFSELNIENFYCSNHAGSVLLNRLHIVPEFNDKTWFKIKNHFCYGLTEVKNGNKESKENLSYAALSTLINALEYEKKSPSIGIKKVQVIIPIIVIKGKLCVVDLDEKNEIRATLVEEGQLLYKSNVYPGVFPLIEIVTLDELPKLAEKIKADIDSILTDYKDEVENLVANFPEKYDANIFGNY